MKYTNGAQLTLTILFGFSMGLIFICVSPTYAITDTFSVQTLVGDDTNPPTTPSSFTATPVATTQIDLSWGASTDDFLLSGYHIYRDDVRIATTTSTSYSDVGLVSSTTYAYYVTAFDSSFNISASSSLVATTTLSPTPSSTSSTTESILRRIFGSRGDPFLDQIVRIQIVPSDDGATIHMTTRDMMRTQVRYGLTPAYELGSIGSERFSRTHEIHIPQLVPNTEYSIILEGELGQGQRGVLYTTTFTTKGAIRTDPVMNVLNLQGDRLDEAVQLTWEYPPSDNFSHVRIVRNDRFYPQDEVDGVVVYEGKETAYTDRDAFSDTNVQYYSVFTYTTDGRRSSGALLVVRREGEDTPPEVHTNVLGISFDDIFLIQGGRRLQATDEKFILDGTREFTVSIPYDAVPEHLKSIMITITNTEGKSFAFLLRRGHDENVYQATIAPFGRKGVYTIALSIFDYESGEVGYSQATMEMVIPTSYVQQPYEDVVTGLIQFFARDGFWFLILTILSLYILFMFRKILTSRWA